MKSIFCLKLIHSSYISFKLQNSFFFLKRKVLNTVAVVCKWDFKWKTREKELRTEEHLEHA